MFSVVATKSKRNSRQLLTVVPSLWVEKKTVYWPPAGLVTLSRDPASLPDKAAWKKSKAKLLGQAESYTEAENLLIRFQNQTDSEWTEDTQAVRAPKPKKGRFESKSYTLDDGNDFTLSAAPVLAQPIQITDPVKKVDEAVAGSSSSSVKSLELQEAVPTPEEQTRAIFQGEGQFVQLPDGTLARVVSNHVDGPVEVPHINPCCDINQIALRLDQMALRLDQIDLKFDRFEHIQTKVDKMLHFAADVHKFLTVRSKPEPQPRSEEDFSEYEKIVIKDKKDLIKLEERLTDFEFAAKLLRYLESVFSLSGKREGKDFFRKFMRKTVPPSILIGYSWTGQTRGMKEGDQPNQSFQSAFPNFIQFTRKLVKKADCMSTDESTNSSFAEFLRQKKTEIRRFGTKPPAVENVTTQSGNDSSADSSDSSDDDEFPGTEFKQE